jgi:hypothetical protein
VAIGAVAEMPIFYWEKVHKKALGKCGKQSRYVLLPVHCYMSKKPIKLGMQKHILAVHWALML